MGKLTSVSDGATYTFETVESVPAGYHVWNVGRDIAGQGYLPLCRLADSQPHRYARLADTDSLKAIKADGALLAMDAAGSGPSDIPAMERYIRRHKGSNIPYIMRRIACMEAALPYLKALRWDDPKMAGRPARRKYDVPREAMRQPMESEYSNEELAGKYVRVISNASYRHYRMIGRIAGFTKRTENGDYARVYFSETGRCANFCRSSLELLN